MYKATHHSEYWNKYNASSRFPIQIEVLWISITRIFVYMWVESRRIRIYLYKINERNIYLFDAWESITHTMIIRAICVYIFILLPLHRESKEYREKKLHNLQRVYFNVSALCTRSRDLHRYTGARVSVNGKYILCIKYRRRRSHDAWSFTIFKNAPLDDGARSTHTHKHITSTQPQPT